MDDFANIVLPEHIAKNLLDKAAERRELGGRDLQQIVRNIRNEDTIKNIARYFRDKFIVMPQFLHKKAGLHALYAISQEICKNEQLARACLEDIIGPMLDCFKDREERVRYTGIEYLFFTCKCMNDIVLLKFDDIYKLLIKNLLDTDEQVRKAALQLDNCLKSLVTSTVPEKQYFRITTFIPIIASKITAKNHLVKLNLISWISTLNTIPYLEMFDYVSEFLKELFLMLAESGVKDPYANEAKGQARKQLDEFQKDIERYTQRNVFNHQQELKTHRQIENTDSSVLGQALNWIQEYLRIVGQELDALNDVPVNPLEMSGPAMIKGINFSQHSVFDQKKESILQQVMMENLNSILQQVLGLLSHENHMISQQAHNINDLMLNIMDKLKDSSKEFIDIMPTIQKMLKEKNSNTAEKALVWMRHLLQTYSDKLLPTIDDILEYIIDRLKDADSSVVQNAMDVLASKSHEQYFDLIIEKILNMFYKNKTMHNKHKKSELILKKICTIWQPELVYTTLCSKLLQRFVYSEDMDIDFVAKLVQCLEYLLLTDKSMLPTRAKLRNYKYEKNEKLYKPTHEFFHNIYRTFCLNPVSAISLSFLAEEYELTYHIILNLSESEADIDTLVQIAKLINQLESPVFAFLRLQLLESSKHPYLLKSLQGLMMLLPQTPIQNLLKQRLKNIDLIADHDQFSIHKEVINKLDTQYMLKVFKSMKAEEHKLRMERERSDNL